MTGTSLEAILKTLTIEDKKSLIETLSRDVLKIEANSVFHNLSSNTAKCPHCGSYHIIKKGLRNGKQVFHCKDCGVKFSIQTKTPLQNTKKPVEIWSQYINLMVDGLSLRAIAENLKINLKTAFYWRHKILTAVQSVKSAKLSGIVEADETYFPKSNKGSKNLPAGTARERGKSKFSVSKRGLSKNQVCVITALDRNNHFFNQPVGYGKVTKMEIRQNLSQQIVKGSTLVTDGDKSYKTLNNVKLIQIVGGITNDKRYNIARTNAYHNDLKHFLDRFRGVATKYLDNYVNFFKAIKISNLNFDNVVSINTYTRQEDINNKVEFKRAA
ncbi:transposase [Spirochaetia bacterium]|nr:transposase [Spirochaetia bacterium]